MNHRHFALSDERTIKHSRESCSDGLESPLVALVERLSKKPYASEIATFWVMGKYFHLAGPMTWTGEMFEGEATAFIVVHIFDGAIHVSFQNKQESLPAVSGGINESEKLIDAYVLRILSDSAKYSLTPSPPCPASARSA